MISLNDLRNRNNDFSAELHELDYNMQMVEKRRRFREVRARKAPTFHLFAETRSV